MQIANYIAGKLAEANKYFQDIKGLDSPESNAEAKEKHGQHAAAGQFGAALGIAGIGAIMSTVPADRIEDIHRLERIVNALESIGVNLDEEDIGAMEGIAAGGACAGRDDIRQKFNGALASWQAESRELEQESAIEALARAGFVLDAEDGETWTRGEGETVNIELVNGRESRYKWEYETNDALAGPSLDTGVSGEFHRLLVLIGAGGSEDAATGPETTNTEVTHG
jgi:hypothetical protein